MSLDESSETVLRLQRRDAGLIRTAWGARGNDLPFVPDREDVHMRLLQHATRFTTECLPIVSRHWQEIVAVKHLDPWRNVLEEAGVPSHPGPRDASELARVLGTPVPSNGLDPESSWPVADIAAGCGYVLVVLSGVPVILVHFTRKKPLPRLALKLIVFVLGTCLVLVSVFHVMSHSGFSESSAFSGPVFRDSRLDGLSDLCLNTFTAEEKIAGGAPSSIVRALCSWPALALGARVGNEGPLRVVFENVQMPVTITVRVDADAYSEVVSKTSDKVEAIAATTTYRVEFHEDEASFRTARVARGSGGPGEEGGDGSVVLAGNVGGSFGKCALRLVAEAASRELRGPFAKTIEVLSRAKAPGASPVRAGKRTGL